MAPSILIAGIGNIFHGDDAFGVAVAQKLATLGLPEHVRVMDAGIRSIDLSFALLQPWDQTILVDATARGGAPGTLYTIEIHPGDIPASSDENVVGNSHSLDPVRALALAKSMGADFRRVLLIGCEPLVLDCEENGHIGLSAAVEAAVEQAVDTIRELIGKCEVIEPRTAEQEVYSHECI